MTNPSTKTDENPLMLHPSGGDPLVLWIGKVVIMDTQGPLIYIGTLTAVHLAMLVLADADVHDSNDSRSSKDFYLVETRELGVRINRSQVMVQRGAIVSVSLLEHVRN